MREENVVQNAAKLLKHLVAGVNDLIRFLWLFEVEIHLICEELFSWIHWQFFALALKLSRESAEVPDEDTDFVGLALGEQGVEQIAPDIACAASDQNVLAIERITETIIVFPVLLRELNWTLLRNILVDRHQIVFVVAGDSHLALDVLKVDVFCFCFYFFLT